MDDKRVVIIKKDNLEIETCINWCDDNYQADSKQYIDHMNSQLNGVNG